MNSSRVCPPQKFECLLLRISNPRTDSSRMATTLGKSFPQPPRGKAAPGGERLEDHLIPFVEPHEVREELVFGWLTGLDRAADEPHGRARRVEVRAPAVCFALRQVQGVRELERRPGERLSRRVVLRQLHELAVYLLQPAHLVERPDEQ